MKKEEKKKAIALRGEGRSIKEIAKTLNVAKSSVSQWVRNIPLTNEQYVFLGEKGHAAEVVEKRRKTRLTNELAKRNLISSKAELDIEEITLKDLKLIGISLYWAEGSKRHRTVSFSNSDPVIIKIMLRFFREIMHVPEEKFRAHIHTYSHLNAKTAEDYWSNVTGIPLTQFYKTYSKPSKSSQGKMDSLPYGTLDLSVHDINIFLNIMGWINKISKILT